MFEPPPRHLYVVSPFDGAAFSFRLTNGIPAKTPDAVITGLSLPIGVAVDQQGYLYVSQGPNGIDVFPPGATGQAQPIRHIPTYTREILAWKTYIVAQDVVDAVNVYDNAGDGTPIEEIPSIHASQGLAVRPGGTLYFTWYSITNITVFNTALFPRRTNAPLAPSQTISRTERTSFSAGIAADDREIFAEVFTGGPQRIDVFPIDSDGPTKPRRVMVTPDCPGGPSQVASYSYALYSRYLYVACNTRQSVLIYNKYGSGRVKPLYILSGLFNSINQIALGP